MAKIPYNGALLVYHAKVTLVHRRSDAVAIAELKVWQVPKCEAFSEGIKYSLFLVHKATGHVLVGYDNHKPKGHHIHVGGAEHVYVFTKVEALLGEFWQMVEERGYLVK